MKTLKFTALLFFVSFQLMAQVSIAFKASGGSSFPVGPSDFKDNWKMGYNAGAGVIINLLGILTVEGEADYNTFALDSDKMLKSIGFSNPGISISGGNLTALSFMANLKLYLIPKISPLTVYLFGGGGLTSMKADEVKVTYQGNTQSFPGTDNQNKVGIQVGAGAQFGIGSTAVFVEAKYVNVFTTDKNTSFAPIKAGLIFGL